MYTVTAAEGVRHEAWTEACHEAESAGWLDPHATPEWADLWTGPGERPACIIMRRQDGGLVAMVPIIMRPILLSTGQPRDLLFDAVSPYGRGGPFAAPGADITQIISSLKGGTFARRLVATYLRGPWGFLKQSQRMAELVQRGNVVVRDLRIADDRLLAEYKHKVRKNINRARGHGLRVERDLHGSRLDAFVSIYRETMQRVGADPWYQFGDTFFEKAAKMLRDGLLSLFHVLDNDAVVSSELVATAGGSRAYSFLGGTSEAGMHRRANDLLKHEMFRNLRDRSFDEFWLGGGKEPEDGIYRYKLSFAPEGAVPSWGSCLIHDDRAYAALLSFVGVDRQGDFFPAYRSTVSSGG